MAAARPDQKRPNRRQEGAATALDAQTDAQTEVRAGAEALAAGFAPLMIEARRLAQTVAAGMHGRRRAGPGESFWQHRPYAFGDPVSMIDWRQSARATGRLYVRQNEWDAAASVWLWRDPSRSLDYASRKDGFTKRRRADVVALALSILLSQAGERVGVIGGRARPFHGRAAPAMVLDALHIEAFAPAGADAPMPTPTATGEGAAIVFISDFFCDLDALGEAADSYAAQGAGGVLFQVLDAAEETFPFTGRTEFADLESDARLTFGDAGAARAEYAAAFADHREGLEALARRLGWTFLSHRTDAPATNALLSLYAVLSRDRALGFIVS